MIDRRDLLMGGAMLVAASGAFALTPRERIEYLGKRKLDMLVPKRVGTWVDKPSTSFVLPRDPDSLSAKLYSEIVTRLYIAPDKIPVMMVIAYGNLQSDLLQLHRPEVCYTSVGFQISSSAAALLPLAAGVGLPVRELTAVADTRIEPICYWTRIGDALPTSGNQQRVMKLEQELRGIVPDGILVRMSTVGESNAASFAALRAFGAELVEAIAPANRPIFIGPTLTAELGAADRRAAGV